MAHGTKLESKYMVGDDIWVPQKLEGRIRPFKTRIFAVQMTDFGTHKKIAYFSNDGQEIDAPVMGTIERCEKIINIIEGHRVNMSKEMDAVQKEELAEGVSMLLDPHGSKIV